MNRPRLEQIVSLFEERTCYDIGSDHSYAPIELFKQSKIDFAYVIEVNEGPLINAKKNLASQPYRDKYELILSDGLQNVESVAKNAGCIIAGMGGNLIIDIIKNDIDKFKKFRQLYLQPNNNEYQLRKFLKENGFNIRKEKLVLDDGIIYEIIVACNFEIKEEIEDLFFGSYDKNDKLFIKKWTDQLDHLKKILKQIPRDNKRYKMIDLEIKKIEKYLGDL